MLDALIVQFRGRLREPRRLVTSIAPVILGVVAFVLAGGFIEYIFHAMREGAIRSQTGHVQISHTGYASKGKAEPYRYLIPGQPEVMQQIAAMPGVLTVAPRLEFTGMLSLGDTTVAVIGEGVDPIKEGELSTAVHVEQGQGLDGADPQGVLLGQGLAQQLGAHIGDTLVILTTTGRGSTGAQEVHVRGVFSSPAKAYDDAAMRTTLSVARGLTHVDGAHRYLVLLKDTTKTDEFYQRIRALLPAAEFDVQPWYALADFYNKTVALFSRQVSVVQFIIATIIVLSVSNTLSMNVMERICEIGTSLAIGLRRRDVLLQFLLEGVVLGVVGALLGLVVGSILAWLISLIGIPMPPPPGMARGYIGQIRVTPGLLMNAAALAVIPSLVASVLPAWKASRLNIVDALRQGR